MTTISTSRLFAIAFWTVGAAFLAYVFARAWLIPVTHDEATTSLLLSRQNYVQLITYRYDYISANNHVLNSLLAKFFSDITGGLSPLAIRSGNLLGAVLYLLTGYVIFTKLLTTNLVRIVGVVLWLGNPYLAEFFALSRGYGISVATEAAAVCLGALYLKNDTARKHFYLTIACVCAILSVWANFTALYFYLCFVIFLGVKMLWKYRDNRKDFKILARSSLVLAFLIVLPLSRLSQVGDFKGFGNYGFFNDTVRGFAKSFFVGQQYFGPGTLIFAQWVLILLFIASCISALVLWRRSAGKMTSQVWLLALFPATFVVYLLVTLVTNSSFLTTRTTLFFYPLLVFSILILFNLAERRSSKFAWGIAIFILPFWVFNFFKNANLTHTYEWDYDRDTYTVLNFIEKTYDAESRTAPYSLRCHCLQHPSFKFYIDWMKSPRYSRVITPDVQEVPCTIGSPVDNNVDFYYVPDKQLEHFRAGYDVVLELSDANEKRVLLRKKG
ncbi:MAG: hypothetical protein OHK0019_07610 [Saprospiraceae bacterium]